MRGTSLPEEFGMGAESHELQNADDVFVLAVDQDVVWPHMAVTASRPFANEFMVVAFRFERDVGGKPVDDVHKVVDERTVAANPLVVFLELTGMFDLAAHAKTATFL